MEAQTTSVVVRVRPPSAIERNARCIMLPDCKSVRFMHQEMSSGLFSYDQVYGEQVSQQDVFQDCRHIVDSVLDGYNGTVLAYGQTGSGKTHTLIGSISKPEEHGIVPRAVQALGDGIAADKTNAEYEVRLSVVEIYCERIRDLLDPSRDNLQVKQDAAGSIFIEGVLEAQVGNEAQLVQVMQTGLASRTVAATCMNQQSSRSHCIVTVTVEKTCPDGTMLVGKLKMVDLAGSERQDKTHAVGQTLVEGSQINKSLSALANVIYALTDTAAGSNITSDGGCSQEVAASSGKHIPYRDSKLTRVLQDSLGGTSRTALIICCSPCVENGPETLSSLRFGSRARGIKNKVTINTRLSPDVLQQQLAKANQKIQDLQKQMAAAHRLMQCPAASVPLPYMNAEAEARKKDIGKQQDITSKKAVAARLCNTSSTSADAAMSASSKRSTTTSRQLVATGASADGAVAAVAEQQGFGHSNCGRLQALFQLSMPWWQHLLVSCLSMAVMATYMSWEEDWCCQEAAIIG